MNIFEKNFSTDKFGLDAVKDIKKFNPMVFLVIARRKNGNVMCYEALKNSSNHITGIRMFWLDIDPKTKQQARKRGRMHDVDKPSIADELVYGITVTQKSKKQWNFHFKRYTRKNISVRLSKSGNKSFAYANSNSGILHCLQSFFVYDRGVKVEKVDVFAVNPKNGVKMTETIMN